MNQLLRILLFLPEQASSLAPQIDILHYVVIMTSVVGAAGVAFATGVFLVRYHSDPGDQRPRAPTPSVPLSIEVGAIGGLLLLFLAFWLAGFRQYMKLRTPPADALEVYVVAKQWMWEFANPDGTASNAELVVPVGRPIKLLMTSRDVIHSFFVPDFRVKQDVVPGRMTFVWFEATRVGRYDILCTEYCGTHHSHMRGSVLVLSAEDYQAWREQKRREQSAGEVAASLAAQGEHVAAERGCLRCHTLDGTPHLGPTWAGVYGSRIRLMDGRDITVDDAYLTESMMEPLAKVRSGFTPIMPSYQGLLSATETAALVELIHTLRDRPPADARAPLPVGGIPR